ACISGRDDLAGSLYLLFLHVLRVLSDELSLPYWRLFAFVFSEKNKQLRLHYASRLFKKNTVG
ncbi:MAG TPA: hypothetical protein VJ440_02325, partial [Candidatus Brocadiaceae bacterium]|nr:hypothetical protein [Candidatus Brocadiaceae bacterium]